jgi:decaprenylphospho-beta-D-erythro-pentofuranosid-2-ulose 2-reductase
MRDASGTYRHVVVIGGTSEIAEALLERLVRAGTRTVTLLARDQHAAARVPLESGVTRTVIRFEAGDPGTHAGIAEQIARAGTDIDLVVVATGLLGDADRAAHDPAYAAQIIGATFTGAATMTGALADVLEQQGHGTIVVLSSVAGMRVRGDNHVYGAAKAGLDGFAQGLAQRLHGTGVNVLIARPGFVRTRMSAHVPAAPFAVDAEQVANDICDALAKGRSTAWSPPLLRFVMGVLRLLPSSVFRRIAAGARGSR